MDTDTRSNFTPAQNEFETISQSLYHLINEKNFKDMAEIFHNDITMDFPGAKNINGKTSVVLFLKRIFSNYENINFKISEAFYSGNKICVAWENNGIRKNGDVYQNRGMTLMRLNNNKIIYLSDYFKNTEIAQVGQSK